LKKPKLQEKGADPAIASRIANRVDPKSNSKELVWSKGVWNLHLNHVREVLRKMKAVSR